MFVLGFKATQWFVLPLEYNQIPDYGLKEDDYKLTTAYRPNPVPYIFSGNKSCIGTHPCPFIYLLFVTDILPQVQNWTVATETMSCKA